MCNLSPRTECHLSRRIEPIDDFFRGQTYSVQRPDGVKQSFACQRGTWDGTTFSPSGNAGLDDGPASRIAVITGVAGAGYANYAGFPVDPLSLVANKSTLEITIRDTYANVVRTETQIWDGAGWNLVSWVNYAYNLANELTSRSSSTGANYSAVYSGERKISETGETGIVLTYGFDAVDRVTSVAKANGPTTTFGYDAAGHVLSTVLGSALTSSQSFDDAGRLLSEAPAGLGTTTYAYNVGARQRTTTLPADALGVQATRVETYQVDGRPASVDGSGVVPSYYVYSLDPSGNGTQWTQAYSGSSTGVTARWQKFQTDWIGRTLHTERPGYSGVANYTEDYAYDSATGRLTTLSRAGSTPIRYQYDEFSRVNRTGLDVDGNGLAIASNDRITDSNQYFENYSGAWWLRQDTITYPYAGSGAALAVSTVRHRLSGFSTSGSLRDEVQSVDVEGNTFDRTVNVTPGTATVTITTSRPDMANTQIETVVTPVPQELRGSGWSW